MAERAMSNFFDHCCEEEQREEATWRESRRQERRVARARRVQQMKTSWSWTRDTRGRGLKTREGSDVPKP